MTPRPSPHTASERASAPRTVRTVLAGGLAVATITAAALGSTAMGSTAASAEQHSHAHDDGETTHVWADAMAVNNRQVKRSGAHRIVGPRTVTPRAAYTVSVTVPVKRATVRRVKVQTRTTGAWRTVRTVRVGVPRRLTTMHLSPARTTTVRHRYVAPRSAGQRQWVSPVLAVKVQRTPVIPSTPTPTPTPTPTTQPTSTPTPSPTATPTPTPTPTKQPTPTPSPTSQPSPTPTPGSEWDAPELTSDDGALGSASDWTWMVSGGRAWNACTVITWNYDPTGSYPTSTADLQRSFARVAGVSGLKFKQVTTDDADITVGWQPRSYFTSSSTAGVAEISFSSREIRRATVNFNLDMTFAPGIEPSPGMTSAGQLFQHEIMHAVGIGHAATNTQIMYPYLSPAAPRFGAGDREGLERSGSLYRPC